MADYINMMVQMKGQILGNFEYRIDYVERDNIINIHRDFIRFFNNQGLLKVLAQHFTPYEQVSYFEDDTFGVSNIIFPFFEETNAYKTIKSMNLNSINISDTNNGLNRAIADIENLNERAIRSLGLRATFEPKISDANYKNGYSYINLDNNTISIIFLASVKADKIKPEQEIIDIDSITVPLDKAEELWDLMSKENVLFKYDGKIYRSWLDWLYDDEEEEW